jgi:DNA-directed RNA polymerase specialized sigma24 family protein
MTRRILIMKYEHEKYESMRVRTVLGRALIAARLLTATDLDAETAVLSAIESWNSEVEDESALVQRALATALKRDADWAIRATNFTLLVPAELKSVLRLPPQLRRCFVLRILEGLTSAQCVGLLRVPPETLNHYTCEALWRLAAVNVRAASVK